MAIIVLYRSCNLDMVAVGKLDDGLVTGTDHLDSATYGKYKISRRSNDHTAVIDYRANDFIVARVQGGFAQEFGTSIAFG
ncbi:hypothetical protein NC651_002726 [Populus alba x Populus x berolinensis]|nr:hypothetical protein NC651_002726 [Populus alba x Populus x berolinensis]